jgi:phosphatidylglycerophosphate synthase
MALYDAKPKFRAALSPIAGALSWLHPDAITLAGLAASGAALACVALGATAGGRGWLLFVPVLLGIRIACNALDGLVAQQTGQARAFGEVVNEGVDRLSDALLFLGLALTRWASWPAAAVAAVAILGASYVGTLGKAVGAGRQYGGWFGKADRMLWYGATAVAAWAHGLHPVTIGGVHFRSVFDVLLAASALLAVLTIVQRVARIRQELTGGLTHG